MGRLLAIDYGLKRTGLAWTDPMQIIATGIGSFDTNQIENKLQELISRELIETVIIGLPLKEDGSDTHNTEPVRQFVMWFNNIYPSVQIVTWDERFTSRNAQQIMIEAGVKKKKRREKHLINQISATLILQDYLSANP